MQPTPVGPLDRSTAGARGARAKKENYRLWRMNQDDPEPLCDWLIRKGYKYVSFRKADLIELRK